MIGGFKQTTSRLAIAVAAGLFTGGIALTPVQAADLGGDCCADLEERVAELEATTVRKGNRKVSLKLSGHVNRALLWWDDGDDSDVYIVDMETSNTRFRLTGSATISPGRTAGFRIENEFHIRDNSSSVSNCDGNDVGVHCMALAHVDNGTDARYQEVWIKDERLGKISLGHSDMASNGISEIDLSGTSVVTYSGLDNTGGAFQFKTTANTYSGIIFGKVYDNFDGLSRDSRIRYDTPSFGGFTFSTSYGQDDLIDAALRFKKEWNSVRCAWGGAVSHVTDKDEKNDDRWIYDTSGSCLHTPSGLNLTLVYGETDEGTSDDDQQFWMAKIGISRRWNSHGKTSIAVTYAQNEDMASKGDQLDNWAIGFVQNIDSAALELYAGYQTHDYSDKTGTKYQDLDFFMLGARMKF